MQPSETIAARAAERIHAITYEALPSAVIAVARTALLDTIGVTLAGAREPAADIARRTLQASGIGGGACTVLGTGLHCGPLDAALLNGVAAHALDFDDCNNTVGGHPSAPMLPAMWALSELAPVEGRRFLAAYVAGFETMAAFGRVLNLYHYQLGWHPTATLGVLAAAAASSHLLGLGRARTATALAIAASLASGVKANFGTMSKPLHVGHAARNGLQAALLANEGFSAEEAAFEHPQGFFEVYNGAGNYALERFDDGWGDPYDLVDPGLAIKAYPCCASTHSAVDAALELRATRRIEGNAIERVAVRTHERRLRHTDRPEPDTALAARFSLQHCVARALLDGAIVMEDFENERYLQAPLRALMAKVETGAHDDDNQFGAYLDIVLADGRSEHTYVATPLGRDAHAPLPPERIAAKFRSCAIRALDERATKATLDAVSEIDAASRVGDLIAQLGDASVSE